MSEFQPITFSEEYHQKYWAGFSNIIVRYHSYLQRGLGLFNEAKYYILAFFGSIFAAEVVEVYGYTIDSQWIVLMAILGLPALILIGRWDLFKASKAREFINAQHASITGYNAYNMTIRNIEQNDEIIDLLKKLNERLK